ncbi:hypothetical protein [Dinghuibacter silviterrae]|nr:hypothetical protein [Dinghuibacter silviterrae]
MTVFPSYFRSAFTRQGEQSPCLWLCLLCMTFCFTVHAQSTTFTGAHTSWHGYDRYDFLMDEATGSLSPIVAQPDEGNGIRHPVAGQRRCILVVPRQPAPGNPWSWQACYWDHQPQAEVELLHRGWCIAFINPEPDTLWDKWYEFLTSKHGLSPKPAFVGMSKGGFNEFLWATAHPGKVSAIYADNPAINQESLSNLWRLAKADVPLLHVCGSLDPILGDPSWVLNNEYQPLYGTRTIETIYRQLGGRISVMYKEGYGHHPHSLRDPKPIADFMEKSFYETPPALPDWVPARAAVRNYYGTQSHSFLQDDVYLTCRGPFFSGSYKRYSFGLDSPKVTVTVIAPAAAAPVSAGHPWVFRADFTEEAPIDLALLARGYYIVTGPVGTNADGPVPGEWDAVYDYLVRHGFSTKPVMEGAGDVYAWAELHPDRVACIYAENPLLRSLVARIQPLDNLAPLARAGVPILHMAGDKNLFFKSNTFVAEQRYKALGGRFHVLPTADSGAVVAFIERATRARAPRIAVGAASPVAVGAAPPVAVGAASPAAVSAAPDYRFDGSISRPVLDAYLSRAITMEGLLNGRGDLTDNLRMLRNIGAKFVGRSLCLWGGEDHLPDNLSRAAAGMPKVRAIDPDMILEACIFEIVTDKVEQVPVPDWAFQALHLPVETRNFRYADMLYPDGRRKDQWGPGASVPDVSRPETKLWFYYLAKSYIDLGIEAIHFGQVELMNGNDPDLSHWASVFALVRAYASAHARRHLVLLDAHTPGGGLVKDGHLLLDFHAFPLRIKEVPDTPQKAKLELGFSDGLYNRSKGGITPSGWSCNHLPYLVEFDNYGVSKHPGQPNEGHGGFDWIWGYDEVTWFALQPQPYRDRWLRYAYDWVRTVDTNAYLEMPGGRTMRSPLDHRRWYYGNRASAATPEGIDVEDAIKTIWASPATRRPEEPSVGAATTSAAPPAAPAPPAGAAAAAQSRAAAPDRGTGPPEPPTLLAGTSKINLTPPSDEPLHDSIYARTLVLEGNGKKIAFVSVDLAVFTSDRIEQICKDTYGLDQVFLCSSHNHSEPQKNGGRSFEKGNPYTTFYENQIIRAVGDAMSHLFPARIAAGHRSFPQLGFNRLIVREDGHARESWYGDAHYTSENPERIPFGPVDPEVGVIRIEDLQGQPRVILMNYACHADVVCFNYAISADYPGVACKKVEGAFGNQVNCLFVQGAGGNVEPLMISSRRTGPNDPFQTDYRPMERTGELLAAETIMLAKMLKTDDTEQTLRLLDDSLTFTGRFNKTLRIPVHLSTLIIDNNIVIAACPGELFSTLQLDWKQKIALGGGNPFLFGYTWSGGRWPGYVADVRSAALGGYGADQDPAIIEVGAGERIMLCQLENYYKLNGLMRDKPGPVGFTPGNRWVITPVPPGK